MTDTIPEGEELEKALAEAYRVYQGNILRTGGLIYELTRGAKGGMPVKELIGIAEKAAERCRFFPEEPAGGGENHGQGAAV